MRYATEASSQERAAAATWITATLGLTPRTSRLLTAVHEAGHAVVADTVGVRAVSVTLSDGARLGDGDDHTHLVMPEHVEIPLPEYLVILTAGFQASYLWLCGRGCLGTIGATAVNQTLTALAGSDIAVVDDLRARWDRPDLHMQDAIRPTAEILESRWSTVVRLAYDLARRGTVAQHELSRHFAAAPASHANHAREKFLHWRNDFVRGSERRSRTAPPITTRSPQR